MEIGFLGGIVRRGQRPRQSPPGHAHWHFSHGQHEAFLHVGGASCTLFESDHIALFIRGSVADSWVRSASSLDRLAQKLVQAYRVEGGLLIEGLEGSFTIGLIDALAGVVIVYRNLVGDHNTYYHETTDGVLFGSNLTDTIKASPTSPRPNDDDLPSLFLNRTIPGRNTLFAGWHRILPGEQLTRRDGRVFLMQRQTLADLREPTPSKGDPLERLEAIMLEICHDYHAQAPDAAGLLSGGVDSSFVQLHWNRARGKKEDPASSFCVAVDHERTAGDRQYAESAAETFGMDHRVIFAEGAYDQYLLETMMQTGELPNHVQLAYYPVLARAMARAGVSAGLNGDGADSLFGLATATAVQNASLLRTLFPTALFRRGGAALANLMRWDRMHGYFQLADQLHDYERLDHPVNRTAVFADWSAVEKCFGKEAVERVAANRRAMLDRYGVPATPLDRLHAAGYFGSAMNTASLTSTMYARWGVRLFTPFLDSRLLRFAINLTPKQRFPFRKPKEILKRSLARHGYAGLAYRRKKSFGQPIFEWLSPSGPLAPLVNRIDRYPFVDAEVLRRTREKPTWFLYSLLCYDLWHKTFIRRSMPLAA